MRVSASVLAKTARRGSRLGASPVGSAIPAVHCVALGRETGEAPREASRMCDVAKPLFSCYLPVPKRDVGKAHPG